MRLWGTEMPKPLVTVLIDTYNHERFIEQSIASVLEQDFPSAQTEVIVVDDGSSDRTPEIVRKFEPRVRLLQKSNGGQASAFNAGIPQAKGEFVAFLDGDDWWPPKKLSRVLEAFREEPALGFVGHGIILTYLDGREMSHVLDEESSFRVRTPETARLFRLRKSFMGTSRMTVRADLLRQILPVPEILTVEADEYIFTIAAVVSDIKILAEPLLYYRIHERNGFQISSANPQGMRRKYEVLAALVQCLPGELNARGADKETIEIVLEWLRTEADQIRLALGEGWSWETVRTEWKAYRIAHAEAPLSHQMFKVLSLLPALALPPKFYYSARKRLAASTIYRDARRRWLPVPEPSHLRNTWTNGASAAVRETNNKP
jgi:glycosyltransferase involved in cell wall biosynthesis